MALLLTRNCFIPNVRMADKDLGVLFINFLIVIKFSTMKAHVEFEGTFLELYFPNLSVRLIIRPNFNNL